MVRAVSYRAVSSVRFWEDRVPRSVSRGGVDLRTVCFVPLHTVAVEGKRCEYLAAEVMGSITVGLCRVPVTCSVLGCQPGVPSVVREPVGAAIISQASYHG